MKTKWAVLAGAVLLTGAVEARAVDAEALCDAWGQRKAALAKLRKSEDSDPSKLSKAMARLHMVEELTETLKRGWKADFDGSRVPLTEEEKTRLQGWLARINPPGESAIRRVGRDLAEMQDKTKAVLETNAKWKAFLEQAKVQALPVSKAEYPEMAKRLIAFMDPNGSMPGLAKLADNPLLLADLLPPPQAQVVNCGDTYLIYQRVIPAPAAGLETGSSVKLGNLAEIWSGVVLPHRTASPPNEPNAPYGDKGVEIPIERRR